MCSVAVAADKYIYICDVVAEIPLSYQCVNGSVDCLALKRKGNIERTAPRKYNATAQTHLPPTKSSTQKEINSLFVYECIIVLCFPCVCMAVYLLLYWYRLRYISAKQRTYA